MNLFYSVANMAFSNRDHVNFKATTNQMDQWIASLRTPMRPNTSDNINPSPHPM